MYLFFLKAEYSVAGSVTHQLDRLQSLSTQPTPHQYRCHPLSTQPTPHQCRCRTLGTQPIPHQYRCRPLGAQPIPHQYRCRPLSAQPIPHQYPSRPLSAQPTPINIDVIRSAHNLPPINIDVVRSAHNLPPINIHHVRSAHNLPPINVNVVLILQRSVQSSLNLGGHCRAFIVARRPVWHVQLHVQDVLTLQGERRVSQSYCATTILFAPLSPSLLRSDPCQYFSEATLVITNQSSLSQLLLTYTNKTCSTIPNQQLFTRTPPPPPILRCHFLTQCSEKGRANIPQSSNRHIILKVRVQMPEWRITLQQYVWQYVQVCRNGWTRCHLTQHWVTSGFSLRNTNRKQI